MLFRFLFSSPDGGLEQFWTNSPPSNRVCFLQFQFLKQGPAFQKEGLDPNKGSTQLYVEISNKRSKVDFKVENIYFCYQYF